MDEHTYRRVTRELERLRGQLAHLYDQERKQLTTETSAPAELAGLAREDWYAARSRAWGSVNGLYAAVITIETRLRELRIEAAVQPGPSGQRGPGARPDDSVRGQIALPLEP